MNAIDWAGRDDAIRVEEPAAQFRRDGAICVAQSNRLQGRVLELFRHRTCGSLRTRWRNDQNVRYRHVRFDRRPAYRAHNRRDTLRRVPGAVLMDRLKIVRAEHQDDEREWRVDLDSLLDSDEAVAAGFERVVPNGSATVQTVL